MFKLFTKPTEPSAAEIEQRRKIARQKQAMERALREQGLSRKQATTIVSKTFKEAMQND
jgi:hypothetical protein